MEVCEAPNAASVACMTGAPARAAARCGPRVCTVTAGMAAFISEAYASLIAFFARPARSCSWIACSRCLSLASASCSVVLRR